jgi:hypothetical protein
MRGWGLKECVLHRVGARRDEQGHVALHHRLEEIAEDPLGYATYLLIAAAAERRKTGAVSARCSADYELARHVCTITVRDPALIDRTMASVEAIAYATVQDERFWRWVEKVSRALVRRRRLTGRDVAELREKVRP